MLVTVLAQPLPTLMLYAGAQGALATPAELSAPIANAPEANVPSSNLP